jgi:hypothetical protein
MEKIVKIINKIAILLVIAVSYTQASMQWMGSGAASAPQYQYQQVIPVAAEHQYSVPTYVPVMYNSPYMMPVNATPVSHYYPAAYAAYTVYPNNNYGVMQQNSGNARKYYSAQHQAQTRQPQLVPVFAQVQTHHDQSSEQAQSQDANSGALQNHDLASQTVAQKQTKQLIRHPAAAASQQESRADDHKNDDQAGESVAGSSVGAQPSYMRVPPHAIAPNSLSPSKSNSVQNEMVMLAPLASSTMPIVVAFGAARTAQGNISKNEQADHQLVVKDAVNTDMLMQLNNLLADQASTVPAVQAATAYAAEPVATAAPPAAAGAGDGNVQIGGDNALVLSWVGEETYFKNSKKPLQERLVKFAQSRTTWAKLPAAQESRIRCFASLIAGEKESTVKLLVSDFDASLTSKLNNAFESFVSSVYDLAKHAMKAKNSKEEKRLVSSFNSNLDSFLTIYQHGTKSNLDEKYKQLRIIDANNAQAAKDLETAKKAKQDYAEPNYGVKPSQLGRALRTNPALKVMKENYDKAIAEKQTEIDNFTKLIAVNELQITQATKELLAIIGSMAQLCFDPREKDACLFINDKLYIDEQLMCDIFVRLETSTNIRDQFLAAIKAFKINPELTKSLYESIRKYVFYKFYHNSINQSVGIEWEIAVAYWLCSVLQPAQQKQMRMNEHCFVGRDRFSREFDIVLPDLLVECKNIKWPNDQHEQQVAKLKQQFTDQSLIAKAFKRCFLIISKQQLVESWKAQLKKMGILYIDPTVAQMPPEICLKNQALNKLHTKNLYNFSGTAVA